jgi:hypothetical protein
VGTAGSHGHRYKACRYQPAVLACTGFAIPPKRGWSMWGRDRSGRGFGHTWPRRPAPTTPQARWFGVPDLECSWTTNDSWLGHQRLELENDLIAAHVLEHGAPPSAQFLG